jgi:hypothetical protein
MMPTGYTPIRKNRPPNARHNCGSALAKKQTAAADATRCRTALNAITETLDLVRGGYPEIPKWIASRVPVPMHAVCNGAAATLRGQPDAVLEDARRMLIAMHTVVPAKGARRPISDCVPVTKTHTPVLNTWLAAIADAIVPITVTIEETLFDGRVPAAARWGKGKRGRSDEATKRRSDGGGKRRSDAGAAGGSV